jgi:hypothetical protein
MVFALAAAHTIEYALRNSTESSVTVVVHLVIISS